jgi:hypothetical protein
MGRPIYPYELGDPDFTWLITHFQENNPRYNAVENTCLPVVFIEHEGEEVELSSTLPLLPPEEVVGEEEQDLT